MKLFSRGGDVECSKSKYCGPAESRLDPPWQWRERRAGISLSVRSKPAERHATLTDVH